MRAMRLRGRKRKWVWVCAALAGLVLGATGIMMFAQKGTAYGEFQGQGDVGTVEHPGSVVFDAAAGTYTLRGSGANMWGTADAFYYVWRRVSGDVTLTADVEWRGTGGNPHRKAGWVIRQGLAPGDPYVDAVVHGDGPTSLQFRKEAGGTTEEVRSPMSSPSTLRLERRGDQFVLSVAGTGQRLQDVASAEVALSDPVYAGLAVCSHDASVTETAVFSHVAMVRNGALSVEEAPVESRLEIISRDGSGRRVVYHARKHFEAPNWSRDGRFLLFNSGGRIFRISVTGGEPEPLDTGSAVRCNNDHGISPDGRWLAISNSPKDQSLIYVLPISGGEPRLLTPQGPSYWHGWSPDGKTLAYCAERNGNFDIYTIPAEGGDEKRLTTAPGLDDGPDYSPDGKYIYFNSERTGLMQIWRMRADGSAQEQVTHDGYADWFAHPSPDGKWLVFLSYDKSVTGHPPNKEVALRLMPVRGGQPRVLVRLFGGQGTINVPSWSPDSRRLAFVSYERVSP